MTDATIILAAGPVELLAAGDKSKPPTFHITAYTGGVMMIAGYGPVVIDLAGADVSGVVPILVDHNQGLDSLAGQGVATIKSNAIHVAGKLTEATPSGAKVIALARSGIVLQASVGYMPSKKEFVRSGEKVSVNGRQLTAPEAGLNLVRSGRLREVSLLSVGADFETQVSIAASAAQKGQRTMEPNETETILKAERSRIAALEAACTGLEFISGDGLQHRVAELRAQAMAGELSMDGLRAEIFRVQRDDIALHKMRSERPRMPAIHASTKDISGDVIQAAFSRTAGLPDLEKSFKPEVLEASDRLGNIGLQETLIMAAGANGYPGGRHRIDSGNMREILGYAFRPIQASGFSTIDVSGILSNTANKFLLSGFNAVEQTWRAISRIRPVNDFKTVTSYRLTGDAVYEELAPAGEIKHGTLGEESYTNQARTYAKMFGISRTDIINDDLGAFDDLWNRLGRGAALKLNDVFWRAFLDNSAFFTAGRGNYQDGANTALTDAGTALTAAEMLFMDLTDADGNVLGIEPAILLVPSALSAITRRLYVAAEIRDTTANTKYPTANIFQQKYKPLTSAYLSKSTYTGYSSTSWYLLADPANLATMEVCFLNGESPTVETSEADFNTLGIQFRGYHDFGCVQSEWRAGVKSLGAAP